MTQIHLTGTQLRVLNFLNGAEIARKCVLWRTWKQNLSTKARGWCYCRPIFV